MATREKLSFCRICVGQCGMVVTVDEADRLVEVRADRDDPQSLGYACFKGLQAAEAHNTDRRILRPQKRQADGSFAAISLDQALDEIAAALRRIIDRDGPEAVAGFMGGGGVNTSSAAMLSRYFLHALGSNKMFSPATIDQSAKFVAANRVGIWTPGRIPFGAGDVFLLVGGNPLLSVATPGFDTRNPSKRLKEAKARGMKFIVIDPRRTETARFADVFLQPLPGEDPTVLAGVLRIILSEGWHDREFCAAHVGDLDRLRAAVEPFTPAYVAARADVSEAELRAVAETFACAPKGGQATSCTGPDMAPHSNLSEHLIEVLNVVCGRYLRAGDRIGNPGVLQPRFPRKAQVIPAPRPWESGPQSRIGYGMIDGEMCTGILSDEILTPGRGQVRALINHGGNPASSVPDQRKAVRALRSLELLVTMEPYWTATARLSHYILPPKLMYERPDLPLWMFEQLVFPEPYTRYTPAVAAPPPGSEVADDVTIFWELAKRLGITLKHGEVPFDMRTRPSVDDVLAIIARHSPVPFAEIQQAERGAVHEGEPQFVEPAEAGWQGRFTLAPDDIEAELHQVLAEANRPGHVVSNGKVYAYRMAVRRHRDLFNSTYRYVPTIQQRLAHNLAFLNPEEMAVLGVAPGDWLEVTSDAGAIEAIVEADPDLRRGVVAITHGFGGLPEETADPESYGRQGVSTNLLISTDRMLEPINAMPRMSAIPVNLRRSLRNSTSLVAE